MIELIGVAVAAVVVFGAWFFLAAVVRDRADDQEQIARAQRYYQEAARKIFEEKHGRRDAA